MKDVKISFLMDKKFYFFIGTRAELIKLFPVMLQFIKNKIAFKVIASGQNDLTKDEIFKTLSLKNKTLFLSKEKIKKTSIGVFSWWIKTFYRSFKILDQTSFKSDKNKVLIIHGDTVSTVMGALIGRCYQARIIHIEAGLRSFNIFSPFPEEVDRLLVSNLSDVHFASNEWALKNLKKKHGDKINTGNNTLLDSLQLILSEDRSSKILAQLKNKKFFIFVLHRQENLANLNFVKRIINLINETVSENLRCFFVLHDNTKYVLEKNNLLDMLRSNNHILISERINYGELMFLMQKAEFLITDGGSNQEESYYLGKPCCLLRNKTERIEGLNKNVLMTGTDANKIDNFIRNYKNWKQPLIDYKKSPSEIIFKKLMI